MPEIKIPVTDYFKEYLNKSGGETGAGGSTKKKDKYGNRTFAFYDQFKNIQNQTRFILDCSTVKPGQYYFLTFKPYDDSYGLFHKSKKFINEIQRKFTKDSGAYLITKEILATKHHCNLLIFTEVDMYKKFHNKSVDGKYKIWCSEPIPFHHYSECPDVSQIARVRDYIIEESLTREFLQYQDYLMFERFEELSSQMQKDIFSDYIQKLHIEMANKYVGPV